MTGFGNPYSYGRGGARGVVGAGRRAKASHVTRGYARSLFRFGVSYGTCHHGQKICSLSSIRRMTGYPSNDWNNRGSYSLQC